MNKTALSALALAVTGYACANVLGIEDAELDPGLGGEESNETPSGTGGSVAASGGTASQQQGAGGQTSAGAGGAGGGPAVPLCEAYCSAVMSNCTGIDAVYTTPEACLAVCELLPEGQEGDETGNSTHCRLRSAEIAPTEPSYYCPIAGPGGNGVCGSNCDGLCTIAQAACDGDDEQWPSGAACQSGCSDLEDLGTFSVDPTFAMYAGGHLQCRLYHAAASALSDPDVHCMHVGGAPPCVP